MSNIFKAFQTSVLNVAKWTCSEVSSFKMLNYKNYIIFAIIVINDVYVVYIIICNNVVNNFNQLPFILL
jgi:hypothetical protein